MLPFGCSTYCCISTASGAEMPAHWGPPPPPPGGGLLAVKIAQTETSELAVTLQPPLPLQPPPQAVKVELASA